MANYLKCGWCGRQILDIDNRKPKYCSHKCSGFASEYKRRKGKLDSLSLEEVNKVASKAGMSYGEYMRQEWASLNEWVKQNGGANTIR